MPKCNNKSLPRLLDDIRVQGRLGMPWFVAPHLRLAWAKHAGQIAMVLADKTMPVLLIDNVADYYYTSSDQEHWDLREHFPNLAPPYSYFWAEHHMPKKIHSKECGDTDVTTLVHNGRVGALIISGRREDVKGEDIPANTKWVLCCELFVDYGHPVGIQGPHGMINMCIDEHGVIIDRPAMQTFSDPIHNEPLQNFNSWLHPTLLAVSFLHCKNVRIEDNRVSQPLAKKWHQKTGQWPTQYKTLVIEPLKQILRQEGKNHEVGLAKAMHICRGHFKDYREGRGLFGKYHQLVWQPSIVRGSRGAQPGPREINIKVQEKS